MRNNAYWRGFVKAAAEEGCTPQQIYTWLKYAVNQAQGQILGGPGTMGGMPGAGSQSMSVQPQIPQLGQQQDLSIPGSPAAQGQIQPPGLPPMQSNPLPVPQAVRPQQVLPFMQGPR